MTKTKNNALRFAVAALSVLLLCGAAFAGAASADEFTLRGAGTVSDPYQISTALDMYNLSKNTSYYHISNPGSTLYFKLMNDIYISDITSIVTNSLYQTVTITSASQGVMTYNWGADTFNQVDWHPGFDGSVVSIDDLSSWPVIGSRYGPTWTTADGTPVTANINFDGNNKKISGLFMNQSIGMGRIGLFGWIQDSAALNITNLKLENSFVYSSCPPSNTGRVGLLIGGTNSNAKVTIRDCIALNSVVSTNSTGTTAGGLIGSLNGGSVLKLENCLVSRCTVTGGDCVSGLIGYAGGSTIYTTNCRVTDCNLMVPNDNPTVTQTPATRYAAIGGLIGVLDTNSAITAVNCDVSDCELIAIKDYVGGLIGRGDQVTSKIEKIDACSVKNCNIKSSGKYVGGLIGYIKTVNTITNSGVMNCIIAGDVFSVGGLIGYAGASGITECTVESCTVAATGAGGYRVGGLVGQAGSASVFSGCELKQVAVLGNNTASVAMVVGSDAGTKKGFDNYTDAQVKNSGRNYLNDNGNAADPKITIVYGGTTVPEEYTQITKLTGIGSSGTYNAVSYVNVAPPNLAGFSIDTANLVNIWASNNPKLYWTTEDSAITIPIAVIKTSGGKFLYAYNVILTGNMTTVADGHQTFQNTVSGWSGASFVNNNWKLAKTADAYGSDKVNIADNVSIFSISIPANTLSDNAYYELMASGELGVTRVAEPQTYADVELSTADSALFPADNGKFIIYVRNTTADVPKTTYYLPYDTPDWYPSLTAGTPGTNFYYFTERLDGEDTTLELTAITSPQYSDLYDTNKWSVSDIKGDMFNGTFAAESVTSDGAGKLTNSIVVNGTACGTATIKLILNGEKGTTKDEKYFTISAESWNKSLVTNDNNRTEDALKGKSAVNWSFVTPLTYNYTVSAGPVNTTGDGWNTHVVFANETLGNAASGTSVAWNATVTCNATGSFRLKNESGKITSGTNFTVVQNSLLDGEKRVLVTLTGFKLGDANIDDTVNIVDSSVVGITVLKGEGSTPGTTFLPAENRLYADCDKNRDGELDVYDILSINRFIVGLDPWE